MLASGLEFDVGGGNEIYKKTEALLGSTRDSDKYTTNILCFKTEKKEVSFSRLIRFLGGLHWTHSPVGAK